MSELDRWAQEEYPLVRNIVTKHRYLAAWRYPMISQPDSIVVT